MRSATHVIGWDDVEACARRLAAGLAAACGVASFDRIVAVARGGFVPAGLLAGLLGVRRVESVQVGLYEGDRRLDAPVLLGGMPGPSGPGGDPRSTLLVDELVDSGATMRFLGGLFPEAQRAALVARGRGGVPRARDGLHPWGSESGGGAWSRPVWVARVLETDRWILFPWSTSEDAAAGGLDPGEVAPEGGSS